MEEVVLLFTSELQEGKEFTKFKPALLRGRFIESFKLVPRPPHAREAATVDFTLWYSAAFQTLSNHVLTKTRLAYTNINDNNTYSTNNNTNTT